MNNIFCIVNNQGNYVTLNIVDSKGNNVLYYNEHVTLNDSNISRDYVRCNFNNMIYSTNQKNKNIYPFEYYYESRDTLQRLNIFINNLKCDTITCSYYFTNYVNKANNSKYSIYIKKIKKNFLNIMFHCSNINIRNISYVIEYNEHNINEIIRMFVTYREIITNILCKK